MKVLIIDLELTCWNYPTEQIPEIIQIGLIEVDTLTRMITRKKEMYVLPEKTEISEFCTELTGITKKQVYKQGIPYDKAIEILEKKFGFKNKLVMGWGRDDKAFRDDVDQYMNLSHFYSMINLTDEKFKLEDAIKREGLTFEGKAHNALVDAENTAKLFIHLMNRIPSIIPKEKVCRTCKDYLSVKGECLSIHTGKTKVANSDTCNYWRENR